MQNMITVSNIADGKASLQRAAISTTVTEPVLSVAEGRSRSAAYAAAIDEDMIQFDSSCSNHRMSNNKLRKDKKLLRLSSTLSIFQSSDHPQQNPDD